MWEFDSWGVDLPATLRLLSELVGGAAIRPGVNCKGAFCTALRPQLPAGACGGGRLMLGSGMQMPAWLTAAMACFVSGLKVHLLCHTCRPPDCCHHVPDRGGSPATW